VFVNARSTRSSIVIGSPLDLVVRARQGKGKPLHFMPFEDFGVAPLGQGVIVHEQVIAQKPDMVRRFLRATTRALNEVTNKQNFEAAVDNAMQLSGAPADRRDSVLLQWQEAIPLLKTKNTAGKPSGRMSEADSLRNPAEDGNDRETVSAEELLHQ